MSKRRSSEEQSGNAAERSSRSPGQVRIIGGTLRGRLIPYGGDQRTRPMKDRVREAVFNLIGPAVQGKWVIDLFAGTGALALEAISRGADRATLLERHFPTARAIREISAELGIANQVTVESADSFIWVKRLTRTGEVSPTLPWLVFCSPPYDFYVERRADMDEMLLALLNAAPPESVFVIEADERFAMDQLPSPEAWDIRPYPPAVIALRQLP